MAKAKALSKSRKPAPVEVETEASRDAAIIAAAREVLQKHWGHSNFRPAQVDIITTAIKGGDVLGVLPTGYGKSATFQVPAVMSQGCTIVVSPLIALMKDQSDDLNLKGIPCSYVNSHVTTEEQAERYSKLIRGEYKLFYVAPERLKTASFIEVVRAAEIARVVIDEAHCVSRWGSDFRPAYRNIHKLVQILRDGGKKVPIMAVTATATADIETDIAIGCGMTPEEYTRVVGDPVRPNLTYTVLNGGAFTFMRSLVQKWNIETGRYVVYSATRNGAVKFAEQIADIIGCPRPSAFKPYNGEKVSFYHAGMKKSEREAVQDGFKSGRTPVIVATCAFGMGIDVPNIRQVIHTGITGCLEDYCQEAGRAGRDTLPAEVVLVNDPFSLSWRQQCIDSANPPYEAYEDSWKWLHMALKQGETLEQTAEQIAVNVNKVMGSKWSAYQIGGTLATMEAYGLVNRAYSQDGTGLSIKHAALKSIFDRAETLPVNQAKAVQYLWERVEEDTWNSETVDLTIDKPDTAEFLQISVDSLTKILKFLESNGVLKVAPSFRGKSTQIARYGVDLDTVLPKDAIVQKREREQKRLDKMIEYTRTPDRVQFIRDYFMNA